MKYILCGILGVVLGFLIFYLLFRIANRKQLFKRESAKKRGKPTFTKVVLVAVLFTYFVGLYQSNAYRLLTIRGTCHIHSNPDNYGNCLVLLESQGRKHYQNQAGIPGGNKGYAR